MRLQAWIEISSNEELRDLILNASGNDRLDIIERSLSLAYPGREWGECSPIDVLTQYMLLEQTKTRILQLPFYANHHRSGTDDEFQQKLPEPWEYKGRQKYLIVHTLAREYGWSMEYIYNLDAYDGMALFQELLLQEQFEKEWQYNLSEKSTKYNKQTKTSTHVPLERPAWMKSTSKKYVFHVKKVPDSAMPIGKVIRSDENDME